MDTRPPRITPTYPLFPYPTLFRSPACAGPIAYARPRLWPRPTAPVTIATLPSRRNWSKERLIDVSWRPSQRSWLLMRTPSPGTRPSGLCRAFEHRRRNIAQHRVCLVVAERFAEQAHVLDQQLCAMCKRCERRLSRIDIEAEAAAAADADQFGERLAVDAELFTGDERVVCDREVRRHQRVVDQFRALAGTDAAEVDDAAGEGLEHRPRGFDRRALAADHHRQGAGRRTGTAAAHGRIDQRN